MKVGVPGQTMMILLVPSIHKSERLCIGLLAFSMGCLALIQIWHKSFVSVMTAFMFLPVLYRFNVNFLRHFRSDSVDCKTKFCAHFVGVVRKACENVKRGRKGDCKICHFSA